MFSSSDTADYNGCSQNVPSSGLSSATAATVFDASGPANACCGKKSSQRAQDHGSLFFCDTPIPPVTSNTKKKTLSFFNDAFFFFFQQCRSAPPFFACRFFLPPEHRWDVRNTGCTGPCCSAAAPATLRAPRRSGGHRRTHPPAPPPHRTPFRCCC